MIYWDFNLVPENDTYPYSNEERLPDGKTYRAASLRGSERGKSVIFDLYPYSKPHPQTALRNNGTGNNFGAEALLAIMDAAAALVIVLSSSVRA